MIVKHLSVRGWFIRSSATSTTTRNCWSFNHLAVRGGSDKEKEVFTMAMNRFQSPRGEGVVQTNMKICGTA